VRRSCLPLVLLAACAPAGELLLDPVEPTSSDALQLTLVSESDEWADAAPTWTVDGADRPDLAGLWLIPPSATARGETWSARVDGDPTLASTEALIGNSAPSITGAWLGPDPADATTPLVASADGWFDADDDGPGFRVTWSVDGVALDAVGAVLEPGPYARGSLVEATITPYDGQSEGEALVATLTVGNAAPPAPTVSIEPGSPILGESLVCVVTAGEDPDGDATTVEVSWAVDGLPYPAEGGPWLGPATTTWADDTVPGEDPSANQDWLCRAVVRDSEAALSDPAEAAVRVVAGPVADLAPTDVNPTSPRTGEPVSPRDYLQKVSGWYFGHAT